MKPKEEEIRLLDAGWRKKLKRNAFGNQYTVWIAPDRFQGVPMEVAVRLQEVFEKAKV